MKYDYSLKHHHKSSNTINYIRLEVKSSDDKDITNVIEDIFLNENMFISTEGYEKVGKYYEARIIIITKAGNE